MGSPMTQKWAMMLAGGALALAGAASAQEQEESTNQVAAKTAWSVFEDQAPRECWAVSAPTETVNTKDGRVVAVRRGDILLMTFYRPDQNVTGQAVTRLLGGPR